MKHVTAGFILAGCLLFVLGGCSDEDKEKVEQIKQDAEKGAKDLGDKAGEAGGKIKEGAAALTEQAKSFLAPLKEKIGGLDNLKDKPAELKKAVEGMIATIEEKAESLNLPEGIKKTVATLKEKLVSLRDYLGGAAPEKEEIEKRVEEVKDAADNL